ncbi:uncharacterized protein EI97DRAFT_246039 [Westerdykella ornata]|uniref:Uncharacterized protein n=1 Tax=Westerdykella ornata TaxID=318751 RepID=A0A6A6JR07_WESOR|nr:uncharacterized protein EI97DRAFT_246039 [Westerdykella ornata]KAF2278136.1 hypothetical protein EI97DRAFT_246039 [Westerdykella ornata]
MPPARASTAQRDEALASTSQTPASLLWGHQLKREHGYLLERMKKVEREHDAFDARIRVVETSSDAMRGAVKDVNRLIEEDGRLEDATKAWITSAEGRLDKFEEAAKKTQSLQPQLSELEARFEVNDGQIQQMLSDHRSILQKIRAFDAELQLKKSEVDRLMQMNEAVNVRELLLRISTLEHHQAQGQEQATAMQDKIHALERTCNAYEAQNAELQARLDNILLQQERSGSHTQIPTQVVDSSVLPMPPPATLSTTDSLPAWMIIDSQAQPPLSMEVPTQVLPSSLPDAQVQVPATSSLELTQAQTSASLREESPLVNAQLRRTNRTEQPVEPGALSRRLDVPWTNARAKTPVSTQTQDLDAPYIRPHVPNSGRRRKALPTYYPPQTRSQVKSQLSRIENVADCRPTKLVILKMPDAWKQDPSISSIPPPLRQAQPAGARKAAWERQRDIHGRFVAKKRDAKPNSSIQKRKAKQQKSKINSRDMEQLEALKSFLKA